MGLASVLRDLVLGAAGDTHSHLLVCFAVVQSHIPAVHAVWDRVALVVVSFLYSVLAVPPSLAIVPGVPLVLDSTFVLDLVAYYQKLES